MSKRSVSVLCTCCGLVSRRPAAFVRARRNFVCGGCKELIPLDRRTVREDVGARRPEGGDHRGQGA